MYLMRLCWNREVRVCRLYRAEMHHNLLAMEKQGRAEAKNKAKKGHKPLKVCARLALLDTGGYIDGRLERLCRVVINITPGKWLVKY